MGKGNLFVISGPSGAGKGTLVARVLQRVPDAWVSVSATTRKPRPGEKDGVHYYFLDDAAFDELIENDGLLEWADVHGKRYGTPKRVVEEQIAAGKQVILEIDVQGALQVREKLPGAILVFVSPPSLEELRRRLEGRATESKAQIEQRLKTAELELAQSPKYDKQFVNDKLEVAVDELVSFIEGKAAEDEGRL
jgi:guanylate kinase